MNKKFDDYPKSFKKTLRYINQDASIEELNNMQKLFISFVEKRKVELATK